MRYQNDVNKINQTIESTFKNLSNIIDVNTVVGKPIKTDDGEYVVPVSKVTVAVLMGGGEYGKVSIFNKESDLPYSAGNGAIISIKPCGFMIKEDNKYRLLSLSEKPYEKLLDKATDFLAEFGSEKENEQKA